MIELLRRMLPSSVKKSVKRRLAVLRARSSVQGVGSLPNEDYNRELWNHYARTWSRGKADVEDQRFTAKKHRKAYLRGLGDEWGRATDVADILDAYITPFVEQTHSVAEIGSGGGRIANQVAPRVATLHCFDISKEMMKEAEHALAGHDNIHFHLQKTSELPVAHTEAFDFVYAFDVLVHLDLHTTWKYFKEIHRVLKKGGSAFVHTANLSAPGGWERFASQDHYSVEGHCFVTPETIELLAEKAGFEIIKRSNIDSRNFYLNRDFLLVLRK